MSELSHNRGNFCTDSEPEEDPRASTREIIEFKKQYEALSHEEKAKLPDWVREYIEQHVSSN